MWSMLQAWEPDAAAQYAEPTVVERVVAVVEGEPILASQVRLDEELAALDPTPLPGWTEVEPDPLQRVISATILRAMAADVALYQPTREQIDARRDALRAAFPDPRAWDAFLARHGRDEEGITTVLRRRMVVEKLLLRNLVTPPDSRERWIAECRALLAQRRPRVRVRLVAPLDAGAPE
jgi:hypothetical protein